MKFIHVFGTLSAAICLMICGNSLADLTFFDDQADFLSAAGTLTFESFETLSIWPQESSDIVTPNFTVSPNEGTKIGVRTIPGWGLHATDGDHYLAANANVTPEPSQTSVSLIFNEGITALGLWITDFGDINPGDLTFSNDVGNAYTLRSSPATLLPDGEKLFFGIINTDNAFLSATFINSCANDGIGLDSVYIKPVPTPSAFLLGSIGLVIASRRLRKRTTA